MATFVGTNGNDTLDGTINGDTFITFGGADTVNADAGNDTIIVGQGGAMGINDVIDGGGGSDTVVLTGNFADYTVSSTGLDIVLTNTATGAVETLTGVEAVAFDDQVVEIVGAGAEGAGGARTIQEAVDDASAGTTILVASGTYEEQVVIDGKDGITLRGVARDDTAETVIIKAPAGSLADTGDTASYGGDVFANVTVSNATGVTIVGVTVDGDFAGDRTPINGATSEIAGVAFLQASGTLTDVVVQNTSNSQAGNFGNQYGSGVFIDNFGSDPLLLVSVTDSTITDFQKTGILVTGAEVAISGNTITGVGATGLTAQNGIQLGDAQGVIDGNVITGLAYIVPSAGVDFDASGIIAFSLTGPLAITNNDFIGEAAGQTTGLFLLGAPALVTVTGNSFDTLDTGIYASSAQTTDGLAVDPDISNNTFISIGENGIFFDPEAVAFGGNFSTTTAFAESGTQFADVLRGSDGGDNFTGLGGDDSLEGRGGNDTLEGGNGSDTYIGGAGDDVITDTGVGGGGGGSQPDVVKPQTTNNTGLANAISIDGAFDLDADPDIFNSTTIPHATIQGTASGTPGGFEFYSFAATAGSTGTFDIDNRDFDTELYLYDANGNELARDDDDTNNIGDEPGLASFLRYTFTADGTYYIAVGQFNDAAPGAGTSYELHVSLENVAVTPDGDTATFDVSTDGADTVNLGAGDDTVNVGGADEIRLTFTSAEVGNGNVNDSNTLPNQDGGLAVRLQAEDASGTLTGPVSRFDDEGISFVAESGTTFDVRDLVSEVERGDQFNVVTLGTSADDDIDAGAAPTSVNYYVNAGQGADNVTSDEGNDFLVGGAGNDTLDAGDGADSFIGGGGDDQIVGGDGVDLARFAGDFADYSVGFSGGTITVTDDAPAVGGNDGVDTLNGVERLAFADTDVLIVDASGALPGFTSIQAAIDAAEAGDTILVAAGTYIETVNLNKDVTLIGANAGTEGSGMRGAESIVTGGIYVTGDGATIDGFAVTGGVQAGGAERPYGVLIGADGVTLTNTLMDGGEVPDGSLNGSRPFGTVAGVETVSVTRNFSTNWTQGAYITIGTTGTINNNDFDTNGNGIVTESVNITISANDFQNSFGSHIAALPFVDVDLTTFILADNTFGGTGPRPIGVFPNEGASGAPQVISGTDFAERFFGDAGLSPGPFDFNGRGGADTLVGSASNDTLNGGAGTDSLVGGDGNDTYRVDVLGDTVTEAANQGIDTVETTANRYVITANVENMTFTGAGTFFGTGNALANVITGGSGNDTLDGGAGADTLNGGAGNDIHIVSELGDVVNETSGTDFVYSSTIDVNLNNYAGVENGRLQVSPGLNLNLTGTSANNTLIGNTGDNVITGGGGRDVLAGGGGIDRFDYNAITDSGLGVNRDSITDFVENNEITGAVGDVIDLFTIDARSSTPLNNAFTFIDTANFSAEGQVRYFVSGGNTIVQISNDADTAVEMEIILNGARTLSDADFVL